MKVFNLLLLTGILTGAAFAQAPAIQNPTDAPTLIVTHFSWRQSVFVPALYDDPMRANDDQRELERDQKATARENADRVKQGQPPLPLPNKKIATNTPVGSTPMGVPLGDEPAGSRNLPAKEDPGLSSIHYIYEVKVKNTGEKTIRAILWVYSLLDPETHVEVGVHRFKDIVSIRAGKTANLVRRSKTPPTSIVQVTKSGQEVQQKYSERVMIDRVEYSDGTFWQRPLN